jgi:hypothetical protein
MIKRAHWLVKYDAGNMFFTGATQPFPPASKSYYSSTARKFLNIKCQQRVCNQTSRAFISGTRFPQDNRFYYRYFTSTYFTALNENTTINLF